MLYSFFLETEACWWCFECEFLWYNYRQQDPPSLIFAHPEQIIKLSLGGSGVATMHHISRVPCAQQSSSPWMEKLAMKTHPYYPSSLWGSWLSLVLGGWKTEQFDSSTNFLVPSKFHTGGFAIFSKRKLNVPHMVLSSCSNGVWFLTKAYERCAF